FQETRPPSRPRLFDEDLLPSSRPRSARRDLHVVEVNFEVSGPGVAPDPELDDEERRDPRLDRGRPAVEDHAPDLNAEVTVGADPEIPPDVGEGVADRGQSLARPSTGGDGL